VHLTRLALTDFRSYAAADLSLGPGISTMLGANGQGKTNLVEAAAYVASLGSHRVSSDAPLVRRGADRAILRAAITSAERDTLVEIEINPGRANRARVNRVPLPRPRQVLGILRAVLFAPEDLALVKGDPEQRRRYLDELLVTSAPRYAGVRADYERVVKQRTALLKQARARSKSPAFARAAARSSPAAGDADPEVPAGMGLAGALDAWDEHLAVKGAELLAGRLELAAALRPLVAQAYTAVSGQEDAVSIGYQQRAAGAGPPGRPPGAPRSPLRAESAAGAADDTGPGGLPCGEEAEPGGLPSREALADGLREAVARSRAEELDRGLCLVGPHRDDLVLSIGGLPARGYASQGESWSMALALRLSSYELLRAGGDDPVLLLDDVFAELDSGRRDRLASLVAGAEQVLVTAAVAADVPAGLHGTRFDVAGGVVSRAS
jgi:DNA replication and repair protein RecF